MFCFFFSFNTFWIFLFFFLTLVMLFVPNQGLNLALGNERTES